MIKNDDENDDQRWSSKIMIKSDHQQWWSKMMVKNDGQ